MSTEATATALPRGFLRAAVLLLLREQPAHGYELLERLGPLGFGREDPGGLYRTLRALESEGWVRSSWEASSNGPARRIYELTRGGMQELHGVARELTRTQELLAAFLSRYGEFVTLSGVPAPPPARGG